MNNPLCSMIDIRYPLIQGGMLWLADARLAAAVSNAGALGTISPCAGMEEAGDPVANFRTQIHRVRQLTLKTFAVNIPLDLRESGLLVNVAVEEQVPVVITAAGNPESFTALFHSAGIHVFHVAGSKKQALSAASCGVDAVIAEGFEAGGRIGRNEAPLYRLLPEVVDSVSIPVIAAGGITDGRAMARVFSLGASAVQMGTRFIAVEECPAHTAYKIALVECGAEDTVVTRRYLQPIRSLRSGFIEKLLAMEESGKPVDQLETFIGRGRARLAQLEGDIDNGDAYAGSSAHLIKEILPAATVIENIIHQYNETVEGLTSNIER